MLINLKFTMESGQPPHFLWNKESGGYWRYVNNKKCYIWMDNGLRYGRGFKKYVFNFLRARDDLEKIYREIATDAAMKQAVERYRGLRLTLNDPWETLICFICSINNNIPRIRKNVQNLMLDGKIMSPEELAKADLEKLKLGFRCKFLKETAQLMDSYDLKKIGKMDYETAKITLMELPGVGEKVADCTLLFGYGFLEAFPTDIWIERAMKIYYRKNRKEIKQFTVRKWGRYAGYAQQYLYCMIREGNYAHSMK